MKIREFRLSNELNLDKMAGYITTKAHKVDAPLMSKMELGHCNMTPDQLNALCAATERKPNDFYHFADVDYGITRGHDHKRSPHRKISVRVPSDFMPDDASFKHMLNTCGYVSITAWLCACLRRLQAEYAARSKKGVTRHGADETATTARI